MTSISANTAMRFTGTLFGQVLAVTLALVLWMAAAGDLTARPRLAAIAVDASSGDIVYQKNIDSTAYPASLTKVMTLYLLFEDMRAGKVSLSSRFTISAHAAAQQPTKLGLKAGESISVRDAIGVVVTRSANDIAVAIAEGLEGSEEAFAARMTRTARAMGMTKTTFHNASGLPDSRQKTTARDMATLGLRIQRDFPKQFHFFSTKTFHYAGRKIGNHNHLLGRVDGVDGIKTGYTRMSGFNLITSIERGGKRMVAVVMGAPTGRWRNAYMTRMVDRLYKTASLKPLRHVAALAGDPPGYVAPPVHQALRVDTPPLPRPKPDLAPDTPVVVAVKAAASQPVVQVPQVPQVASALKNSAGCTAARAGRQQYRQAGHHVQDGHRGDLGHHRQGHGADINYRQDRRCHAGGRRKSPAGAARHRGRPPAVSLLEHSGRRLSHARGRQAAHRCGLVDRHKSAGCQIRLYHEGRCGG